MEEENSTNNPVAWTVANWITAICNFGASFSCLFVIAAILISNKTTRKSPFNVYVLFLMLPDALFTMINGGHYASRALETSLTPPYEVSSFGFFFYFACNFYTNGVVTFEVHKLITQSNKRQRTPPPDLRRVYTQVATAYFLTTILALWAALPVSWSLSHISNREEGEGTMGSPPGGTFSYLAGVILAYALVVIPPSSYVVFVSIRVWRKKLLPRKGRTRALSLFFLRVIVVFVLFYFPNLMLSLAQSRAKSPSTVFWFRIVRGLLNAGQAFTTLYLISAKDDIREVIVHAYSKTIGQVCCTISTSKSNSEVKRSRVQISGLNTTEERQNASSTTNTLQSEWEAEDEYDDDQLLNDKSNNVQDHQIDTTVIDPKVNAGKPQWKSINMLGDLKLQDNKEAKYNGQALSSYITRPSLE
mmetsp:Transcript_4567/g.10816  ORF Transcript_4567/g.10816 Transcript_4567/m.10816 type:complete len:416 (-) Transcript_4567:190-1437(-)